MLAWRLHLAGALAGFDPYSMVRRAACYLISHGPATPQERWEENSGYSPSTLASNIAGLLCAAAFARLRDDEASARFLAEYADFLEAHVEAWTVTTAGTLVPGIRRHYIRITPEDTGNPIPHEDPDHSVIGIRNCAPDAQADFPAREIVDAGFLELVRYGIRKGGDPLIEDSLRVIDAVLKTDFPAGPCWRRYNHDGYGQRNDGGAYVGWGVGRPWPLLTGERGHYELAAGRDATRYLRAMENFATATRLLPEQIWDGPDNPPAHMVFGKPTGAAMPLMWAHAEYIKLLRSVADGGVFDLIPEVAERYLNNRGRRDLEVWKHNRQVQSVPAGCVLRIQAADPFMLHWSNDEWKTPVDTASQTTAIGIHFVDVASARDDRAPILFTFRWLDDGRWEGHDYKVDVRAG
jgi:glucoamylase